MSYFEIQEGPDAGKRIEIPEDTGEILLGRSPECHLVVSAPSVSRKHARLRREGLRFVLEDLGSANGTLVNGERLQGSIEIQDQDSVSLGTVQTRFVNPPLPPEADATMMVPPEADATIAVPPSTAPPPAPEAVPAEEPGTEATPAPEPAPVESAPPPAATAATAAPAPAPTRDAAAETPQPTALLTERLPGSQAPSPLELLAIGVGSFLAVFGLGWLLL